MQREPRSGYDAVESPEGTVVLRAGLEEVEARAWGAFEGEQLKLLRAALLSAPSAEIVAARWGDLASGGALPVAVIGSRFGERETLRLLRRLRGPHRWVPVVMLLGEGQRGLAESALAEGVCDLVPVAEVDGDRLARALRFATAVSGARLREELWSRRCGELEIRLEGLHDLIDDAVLLVDDRRRIRWASRAVEDLLGSAPAALVGRPFAALGWVEPERAWNGLAGLLSSDGAQLEVERPDGRRRLLGVRARRLDASDGRGERLRLVLLRDRGYPAKDAEERRLIALGRLAAGVGHDVNNLLAPVLGYAELVRAASSDPDRVTRYAEEIERSAVAAADLVRGLLQVARSSSPKPVDLEADALVEQALPLLRALVGAAVSLELALGAPGIGIRLRPGELEQILLNLVGNARDAMAGGGSVRLRTRHDESGHWLLEVEDDGVGIPTEDLGRLFQPGFTTKRDSASGGLGLWIVRGIVEQAGGGIEVASPPGRGAHVTVRLPARGAAGGA